MSTKKFATNSKSAGKSEFSGHVGAISVDGNGNRFQFDLVSKKKDRWFFILNSANSESFATMAALVTSSYMFGKKIHVKSESNGDGLPFAVEVRVGTKSDAPKVKQAIAPVRAKGMLGDGVAA